jgi:hypothetical protein
MRLQAEEEAARRLGIPWQERGPPGPDSGGPDYWRGQTYRTGSAGGQARWGNRGGRHREYYAELARIGYVGNVDKGKGKSGGKGKEQSKSKGKGKNKSEGKSGDFKGKGKGDGKSKGSSSKLQVNLMLT